MGIPLAQGSSIVVEKSNERYKIDVDAIDMVRRKDLQMIRSGNSIGIRCEYVAKVMNTDTVQRDNALTSTNLWRMY